jgi:quaternary ammonium compound-resistance protein SugE
MRTAYPLLMPWTMLVVAGVLEVVWAVGLKFTDGFTRLWPSVWTLAAMLASFYLLSRALQTLPVGTGYAVWTGIGAAGTAIVGMLVLGESASTWRLVSLALIVAGIVGLKVAG